jgi:Lon protease-like protein
MTNFIPIFPLNVVVYPGEILNLHIFEPRYKELVKECFGHVAEYGTLVTIREIAQEYDNGEMDIITNGTIVFRILEIIKKIPDKLYSGAIVNYPENAEVYHRKELMQVVIKAIRELHRILNISKDFRKPDEELNAYDLAHHAGLSIEEEYEMLALFREEQRQEYLKRHLGKVLPVVVEMEVLKGRIMLNGHFKNLSSFRFE